MTMRCPNCKRLRQRIQYLEAVLKITRESKKLADESTDEWRRIAMDKIIKKGARV